MSVMLQSLGGCHSCRAISCNILGCGMVASYRRPSFGCQPFWSM